MTAWPRRHRRARVERQYGNEPVRDLGCRLRGRVRAGRAGRLRGDRPQLPRRARGRRRGGAPGRPDHPGRLELPAGLGRDRARAPESAADRHGRRPGRRHRTTSPTLVARYQTGGGFTRLFGADRYATAAAISSNTFAPGVPTAYVTTGENWPDALAAVPHAARAGGPLLLTRGSALPASIAAELDRLDPGRIIVVGGSTARLRWRSWPRSTRTTPGAACSASAARIATTRPRCSRPSTIRPVRPLAYVATGQNFPDALGAGPAAAVRGAPDDPRQVRP